MSVAEDRRNVPVGMPVEVNAPLCLLGLLLLFVEFGHRGCFLVGDSANDENKDVDVETLELKLDEAMKLKWMEFSDDYKTTPRMRNC